LVEVGIVPPEKIRKEMHIKMSQRRIQLKRNDDPHQTSPGQRPEAVAAKTEHSDAEMVAFIHDKK
jgi:hypothetical protein